MTGEDVSHDYKLLSGNGEILCEHCAVMRMPLSRKNKGRGVSRKALEWGWVLLAFCHEQSLFCEW
uniref:Uncharacterized protein n=1 Tax=Vibrio sp. FF_273 TaxID=1652830 RepID=A0A0H4A1N1_9VIBR|nr:hypothetical protein [Vibrio sp. FF_273]